MTLTKERETNPESEEAIISFIALYNMLGSIELYDGIDETYENIIYWKDN